MIKLVRSNYITDPVYVEFLRKGNYLKAVAMLASLPEDSSVLIIHDSDPDGCCANALMRTYVSEYLKVKKVSSIPMSHGYTFQNIDIGNYIREEYTTVIILDQAVDYNMMVRLKAKAEYVLVFDHHPETVASSLDRTLVISSTRWSATALVDGLLTVKALNGKVTEDHDYIPPHYNLTRVVNHYDCYLFNEDFKFDDITRPFIAEVLNVAAVNAPWTRMIKEGWSSTGVFGKFCLKGIDLLANQKKAIERIVKNNMVRMVYHDDVQGDLNYGLIFNSDHMDAMAEHALREYPSLDFVVIAYIQARQDKCFKLSLRSTEGRADVNRIAVAIGHGGGHRLASRVEVDFDTFSSFIQGSDPSTSTFGTLT